MTLRLENDSSRDFLDAVLGLRSILARVRLAGADATPERLSDDDPAVLLLLGLLAVEKRLYLWINSLDYPVDEVTVRPDIDHIERLMR